MTDSIINVYSNKNKNKFKFIKLIETKLKKNKILTIFLKIEIYHFIIQP